MNDMTLVLLVGALLGIISTLLVQVGALFVWALTIINAIGGTL
jgi:hypothetical protein